MAVFLSFWSESLGGDFVSSSALGFVTVVGGCCSSGYDRHR